MKNVLITGISSISSYGHHIDDTWPLLQQQESLPDIFLYNGPDDKLNKQAYKLKNLDKLPVIEPSFGELSNYALYGVKDLFADAGIVSKDYTKAGTVIGTAMGNILTIEDANRDSRIIQSQQHFHFDAGLDIANYYGLTGPNICVSNACAAGLFAICEAIKMIQSGEQEIMLVGGIEIGGRVVRGAFNRMGALDEKCCRPFDKERGGTVFGQGLSFLLLESDSHFKQRGGVKKYGKILGHGLSCDAFHVTRPRIKGELIEKAVCDALRNSQLSPSQIDAILPHATGTPLNDMVEGAMLKRVFGNHLEKIKLCATKSHTGHIGGGSPAFASVIAAKILETQMIPTTANYQSIDPRCDFSNNISTNQFIAGEINNILVCAYGFGGNNSAVVFST
ncbi:beta-ketoacyl-[acyl-carrier-protein] synthase family protein [Aliikangiella sp. IMCC44359]|uniref:beta-ketoacyl-[acyl-carrier-protein] synthase family protein n=1 Tax=Aliikangiella sp. IMCC44359 TaxID=3459125 RepID=UPI00403B07B5